MRRAMAVLTVVGAGLACLTAAGRRSPGRRRHRRSRPPRVEGQAEAKAALLVLSDFPGGLDRGARGGADRPGARLPGPNRRSVRAAAGTSSTSADPVRETPDFVGPDDQRVEQSVTIVDAAIAEDLIARFAAPGVDTCFRDAARAFVAESFESPADPSESPPGAVQIGDVTIGDVLLPPAGDELVAYRVTVPLTVSGVDVDAFVDVVVVRSGGSLSGFTFQSVFEPFPADEVEHYIDVVVERLPRLTGPPLPLSCGAYRSRVTTRAPVPLRLTCS